ncbi:unnamed protein product [Didymodactylos carnosus]|uniref:Transducer of regulated CREB activity N-terminal domain-containing protein n=1 Tax=Didymodactylos carnosus TaxID=1234261 RepID=A0A813QEL3_9BILA|nr:unnamed protein product [Didymodactylos carnosus]CAF3547365.1 unnamed protein product [Didymodactylos carnosus]
MTNPRKFAEKIALMQQKAAEGDAAFSKIIYEVEAAKQPVHLYDSQSSDHHLQQQPQFQQFHINNNCHIFDQSDNSQPYNDFMQTNNNINTIHHVPNTTNTIRCGNVLMLPTSQHPPHGGSLPDLSSFQHQSSMSHRQQQSYSSTPLSSSLYSQQFHHIQPRSSNHRNKSSISDDLFSLGPQQQLTSNIGPVKGPSPGIRRRHSPIGDGKITSPRRQNSPSPDVCSNQQTIYRVEPSSPQSQSSYSPQGSPHLLSSPANDMGPFSPQDNNQPYFTLPNQFDQISLEGSFVFAQGSSNTSHNHLNSSNGGPYTNSHQSTSATSSTTHNLNCLRPRTFFPTFIDDLSPYCQSQTVMTVSTKTSQKSPTIPNIILTDADSSKSDLSKDLSDFSNSFENLLNSDDLLDDNDFVRKLLFEK